MSLSSRELYRLYLDFLETAETKRRWSVFNDIPWEKLDSGHTTEANAQSVELFCSEEMYVPDYSANGLQLVRSMFGHAWFQTCWAFEESKHALVFREYLTRSGSRTEQDFAAIEEAIFANAWKLPFDTTRRMACYGALQEAATYAAYKGQRDKAVQAGDKILESIFFFVGRDEAAHAGFYRAVVELELTQDRAGTIGDLAYVLSNFKMPGDGLIPNYRQRLQSTGAGISPRVFLERVVSPLLTTLQIARDEMKSAMKRNGADTPSSR